MDLTPTPDQLPTFLIGSESGGSGKQRWLAGSQVGDR